MQKSIDENTIKPEMELLIKKSDIEKKTVKKSKNVGASNEQCDKYFNDNEQEISILYDEINRYYFSPEEFANVGPYSTLTPEDIRILAEANDVKALHVYGTNLMWEGGVGIKFFFNEQHYKRPSNKEIVSHKLDLELINIGKGLLLKAAYMGHLGSLVESRVGDSFILEKFRKNKLSDMALLKTALINTAVTYKLVNQSKKNDPYLRALIYNTSIKEFKPMSLRGIIETEWHNVKRIRSDLGTLDIEELESLAEAQYDESLITWIESRRYYGQEPYPKIIKGQLKEIAEKYIAVCLKSDY